MNPATHFPRRGSSLAETVVAVAIVALLAAVAVPELAQVRSRARVEAGAREVASLFHKCRSQAVSRSRSVALKFERQGNSYLYAVYEDTNGDGIKISDIASGADGLVAGPSHIDDSAQGVEFSILQRPPIHKIPPQSGSITNMSDPIQFGSLDLVSFTPLGSATSGTAYLSDGDHMQAVVLYGPTGRTRVWRYVNEQNRWVQ